MSPRAVDYLARAAAYETSRRLGTATTSAADALAKQWDELSDDDRARLAKDGRGRWTVAEDLVAGQR